MSTQAEHAEEQDISPEEIPAPPAAAELGREEVETPSAPPILSGKSFLRKGLLRWVVMGGIRYCYRIWTRIAVRAFPESSRRAAFANRIGLPLPDRLNMSWVTPQLAVGGRIHPGDIARLAAKGVTRVVDTRSEHQDDAEALAKASIELLYLPTRDTFPLTVAQLREGADWINQQIADGQHVLIHCEHGVGRSVLLTAAALVAQGMGAHHALDLIQRHRWQAAPNHRQIRRLQEFERSIHAPIPQR